MGVIDRESETVGPDLYGIGVEVPLVYGASAVSWGIINAQRIGVVGMNRLVGEIFVIQAFHNINLASIGPTLILGQHPESGPSTGSTKQTGTDFKPSVTKQFF